MASETDLHVSKRLQALLPVHSKEERDQLEANVIEAGEKSDPIYWWKDGATNIIVDGMTSWHIVQKHKLPYTTKELHFASYDEAELWILNHQLGRRNLLTKAKITKVVGELYNRLKRTDGGHGNQTQKAEDQFDTPLPTAAATVAEDSGLSEPTVKRAGAIREILAKLPKTIREKVDSGAIDPPAAELKRMASLPEGKQGDIAAALRMTRAKTLAEAFTQCGITKAPPKTTTPKAKSTPPKQYDRSYWFKQWEQSIGPLVRLVDKIAKEIGESKSESHKTVQEHLNIATEELMAWLGVKKK